MKTDEMYENKLYQEIYWINHPTKTTRIPHCIATISLGNRIVQAVLYLFVTHIPCRVYIRGEDKSIDTDDNEWMNQESDGLMKSFHHRFVSRNKWVSLIKDLSYFHLFDSSKRVLRAPFVCLAEACGMSQIDSKGSSEN